MRPPPSRSARRSNARRALASAFALLAAFLAAAGARAAEEPDLTWLDRAALSAGQVLVRADRSVRPLTVLVEVATEIDAPPEAIWDVLKACELSPQYVPNIVSCRSLEKLDDGRSELFIQVVKPAFFVPTFEHVFRLDYQPYSRIDVHRVSGPIAYMEGTWWLLPQPSGKILLYYQIEVDPGVPVPRFFVRATLKRDLPRLVGAIRDRAQAQR